MHLYGSLPCISAWLYLSMALVERMSILGIRSFDHETPQKIEFFTPVTLILGHNGTGKTTIIECLKYATTGDLPPGSKTGCSFIHDPRVARETEVKAKVTLQIRDVQGQPMVISRALVATQRDKNKQGTLKTLDGSIKRQLPDGRHTSISSKCAELDNEMVTSLGVSKAVLENVIFCHQEDSNWPLQEAKAVKQRFDDLFASSRYVKALDAIRKCKQEKDSNIKIYKTELKHLGKSREEANKLRNERQDLQQSIENEQRTLASVQQKLDPIVERLNLYKQKYAELIQIQAEIKSCETEKSHLDESVHNLLANIKSEFEGTDEELATVVENADAELDRKQLYLTQLDEAIQLNRMKLRDAESQRNKLSVEIAQLEMQVKHLKDGISTRDNLLLSALQHYNLPVFDDLPANEEQVASAVRHLNSLLRSVDASETELKIRLRAAENEDNERVSLSINELARVEQNSEDVQLNLHETNQELSTIQRKLENAQSITSRMALIRSEVDRASERVERLQSTTELSDARKKLKRLTDELRVIDQSLLAVDEKISVCQQNAAQRQELEALLKDRNTKLETARKIRSRHLESLEHVFGSNAVPAVISDKAIDQEVNRREQRVQPDSTMPPRLRQSFLAQMSRLEQDTRETRKRLAKSEQERSVLETKTKFTRSQLQEKQSRLQQMEERILVAAGSSDLEQCLNRLQQKRKLLEEECANEQGSLYLWRKFRDRLARTDPDCPVCHRHLSDLSEQNELLSELDQRIRSMPDEFARKKLELSDLVTQHETLLELRPISLDVERLRSTDLPELESRLTSEQSALEKARNLSEEETARLESCQADEALAKSVQGDLAVFERIENELIDIGVKLKRLQSDGHDTSDAGVDLIGVLQEERRTLRAKQSSCSNDITECQERINRLDEAQREATAELHRVKDALHQLEQENQSNLRLTEDFNRLTELAKNLQSKLTTLESSDLPVARRARDLAVDNRTRKTAEREKQLEQSNEKTRKLRDLIKQIEQACEVVSSASQLGCESRLEQTRERLCTVEGNISHLHSVADKNLTDLEQARKQLNEHKIRQRELTDCIQLRQLRSQLGQLKFRIQELNDRLRSCHAVVGTDQDLVKETKQLSVTEERLQAEKNALTSQLGQLTAKLQYFSQDLKEKYANADKDFLDMMYQLKTTELACSDLERYYKALDRAIMAYHATKMMDLNKIIRELWRNTYRGNDIDYIEICSEEDCSSTGSSTTSNAIRTRRTYNYRVVMVKGTTGGSSAFPATGRSTKASAARSNEARLDMRGRCSAGQKVLASLIIRLALAEVFCLHCGVLALDEPTTNLDRENIESLAYALVEIIKNRRQQKNFQLIVITHDEDFVELLGRSDYVENFFLLSRNTQGLSEIRKVPIEDHFH